MTEVKEHNTFYSEEGVNEKNTKEVDTLWKHAVYNAKRKIILIWRRNVIFVQNTKYL